MFWSYMVPEKETQLMCDTPEYGCVMWPCLWRCFVAHGEWNRKADCNLRCDHCHQLADCNSAQTEKEALSILFGIKSFHKYLYGRTCNVADQPLITLQRERAVSWSLLGYIDGLHSLQATAR